jgi:hypothetical protein
VARYKNVNSGAIVSVREDKVLGSEWEPFDKAKKDASTGHNALKVPELKAEIEKRNEGRDEADLISAEGNKADLVAALDADDAKS